MNKDDIKQSLYKSYRRHYEKAFPLQQQLMEVYAESIPQVHDGVARAAVAVSEIDQNLSGNEKARDIARSALNDLTAALEAIDRLDTANQRAVQEAAAGIEVAGVATMKLRELEDAPADIAQSTIVIGMILENVDMIAKNHGGTQGGDHRRR